MSLVPYNRIPLLSLNFYLSGPHVVHTHPLVILDVIAYLPFLQSSYIEPKCSMVSQRYRYNMTAWNE